MPIGRNHSIEQNEREQNIISHCTYDTDDDDVAELLKDPQFRRLFLFVQFLDGVHERLKDPEVDDAVDTRETPPIDATWKKEEDGKEKGCSLR